MKQTNCSFDDVNEQIRILQLIVHIPTCILGLILNVLAIRSFSIFLKKRRPYYASTCICMINLAVFHLLLVLSLPFKMFLSNNKLYHLPSFCTMIECLYFVSMYGSIYTNCLISLDRFLAIQYPLLSSYIRSPKKIAMTCCIIWVLVGTGTIPIYKFHEPEGEFRCFHNLSKSTWSAEVIFPLEVFGFLLPLVIVGFCSSKCIHILLGRRDYTQDWIQQKACIYTIAVNLAVFVVSFLPVHLGFFLQFLVRNDIIQECRAQQNISFFLQLSLCLSNTNCCLDVFYYYFIIKEFRMDIMAHQPSSSHLVLQDTMTTRTGGTRNCSDENDLSPEF
ncbi:PREDICTED: G-protein coupled receptor 55 [Chrysochloris asiatica]|uniref:G-protein coupled receptor 55 n=1 Tax=Chrysochloris asiatica TaxID=185453 RepID=A0A9B0TTU7_CHRAS|nr:PREDICTED: G-protein coupled receptor 55 [Chrysochloris asiatica]